MRNILFASLLAGLFLNPQTACALEATSRLGAEMKAIQTPSGAGILFGWRYLFHTSPYFSIGGAGFTGQIATGATGSFSYGGMIGAFHVPFTQLVSMEVTILGGGGGGRLGDGTYFGGTVVEPGLGFSFKLGKAVQFVAGGSYVWMPGSAQGTGPTGGVKFEFLSDHRSEPVVPRDPPREAIRDLRPAPAATPPGPVSAPQSYNANPVPNRATASTRD